MYINEADQDHIVELINSYLLESQNGIEITRRSDLLMRKLFYYMDKIILGMIYCPNYRFNTYAEVEELFQEARLAIVASIHKQQYDPTKGRPFNFFSTVISRNLMNYTCKLNKHMGKKSETDITNLYNNESITYHVDFENVILFENIIDMLMVYFEGKENFQKLTGLLINYHDVNGGKRFIKKHFMLYAKGHGYSPALTNTFFNYLKRFGKQHAMRDIMSILSFEENLKAKRIQH